MKSKRKYPSLSREEYKALLDAGHKFRDAGLYEPDHAPRDTKFFYVYLLKNVPTFKRML